MTRAAATPSPAPATPPRRPRARPRAALCAVCTRPAHGFGWFDPRRSRPHRTLASRWFCSMGCQSAFALKARKGLHVIDFTEEETQALPAVMRALAPEMERIGWDRPLAELTRNDMHRLIVIAIEAFRAEMAEIAEIAAAAEVPF